MFAQQPEKKKVEGARDLFYFGATHKDTLPPIQKTSAPKTPRPAATQSASAPKTPAAPVTAAPAYADSASTLHLGFRYTVQLVNQTTNKSEPVDPDRNFKKGECVRMEVESNQSGYLYVLSKQSSGGWLPLFPSSEMPDETNVADPGVKVRAPKDYCFEIDNPPGTETLFVVLSRSPRDFFELYDAIKTPAATSPGSDAETREERSCLGVQRPRKENKRRDRPRSRRRGMLLKRRPALSKRAWRKRSSSRPLRAKCYASSRPRRLKSHRFCTPLPSTPPASARRSSRA